MALFYGESRIEKGKLRRNFLGFSYILSIQYKCTIKKS